MNLALLIDFGSTFTKIAAVDVDGDTVLATARAFSTVETNIMEGFFKALHELEYSAGLNNPPYNYKLACSSAAGGLKMVAVGLVADLTAEAAKRAALGAGARVVGVFSHELTGAEVGKIAAQRPDIILLAGGTDGGNRDVILHNAGQLAAANLQVPVVIAGNKTAAEDIRTILTAAGIDARITANVMPELNVLNIDPARETIRHVFLEKIVAAKGLNKAEEFIDRVMMPTPAAVLKAAQLLSQGFEEEPGLGEILVVDIGGATTDVHSIATGEPSKAGVSLKGLPEPFAKRTVEGDLGMRYSAQALVESAGLSRVARNCLAAREDILAHLRDIAADPSLVSISDVAKQVDDALAFTAVDLAVERHTGSIETVYTPFGASYIQIGKDLTQAQVLIGTGGVIVYHRDPAEILRGALFNQERPTVLKPMEPKFFIDREYIMAAMGLLAEVQPLAALRIMKKYLREI